MARNASELYRQWGIPRVRPYVVAKYRNGGIVVAAPPGSPSLLHHHDRWQHCNSCLLRSAELVFGESVWEPSQVTHLLALFIEGHWTAWTDSGLVALTTSAFGEIATGSLRPITIDGWVPSDDFRDSLERLGFALTEAASPSIQDSLARRSNDYSIASGVCSSLLGLDIVSGDGLSLNISQAAGSLSVVIPSFDSVSTVYGVVQAVVAAARHLPTGITCEVIVVDDASTPALVLDRFPAGTRLIHSHSRLYAGMARNLGLLLARGQLIVFLDADTYIAPNYLVNHWLRHQVFPNLVLVSLRDYIEATDGPPERAPVSHQDTRWQATYSPSWKGLRPVEEEITISPLFDTDFFRTFGYGRTVGPTDLPFMVKGNNLSATRRASLDARFPPHFEGWGPEDVCFAAKLIARGAFVVPVLSTGVFHVNHPPRSGTWERREEELVRNLGTYASYLESSAFDDWEEER